MESDDTLYSGFRLNEEAACLRARRRCRDREGADSSAISNRCISGILQMSSYTRLNKSVYGWRGAAFGAGLAVLLSAASLFGPCGTAGTAFAQQSEIPDSSQDENGARPLETAKPIKRELAGGERHRYQIRLAAGQFLKVIVEQQGIDVVAQLSGP